MDSYFLKRIFFFILLLHLTLSSVIANSETTEDFLPIGLTEEELGRLDEIGMYHQRTAPPTGMIRNPGEWEPSEGVIIRWPLGIPLSLVAELSEDLIVTTLVGSAAQETSARNSYTSNGVTMSNTEFIIAPTDSIWTRDYGPWFIFEDEQLAIVDHVYNRPRPLDDVIPQYIGAEWGLNVYGMDVIHTGGNHMSQGLGMSMSTELVYDENPLKPESEVDSMMLQYLGNDYTVLDYIESGGIHHIDCWAKFLDPATILVKDVPPSNPSYNLLNARADFLSQQMSAWNRPYTVYRVYCPAGTAYTNSIILNNKVFVPIFNNASDATAIATYQAAMPGYEILGFTGSWLDDDAIHCRTMGVPDRGMLYIRHIPSSDPTATLDGYLISAEIIAHSGADLIDSEVKIYYSVDGGPWQHRPLSHTGIPHTFSGHIPLQLLQSQVSYYLHAADLSGRAENHPYQGSARPHTFVVTTTVPTLTEWGFAIILVLFLLVFYTDSQRRKKLFLN